MNKLDKYLAEVKARCEKASPGPWYSDGCDIWTDEKSAAGKFYFVASCLDEHNDDSRRDNRPNAALLAHSRTDVQVLLKMLEATRKHAELHTLGHLPTLERLVPGEDEK